MADVRLKNICKVYDSRDKGHGGVLAVKNFSMDIKDGEFIVFVGPSGCGKSTTLRMIAGLEDISSGDLYIDGTYVNDVPAKDRNIAMVFQNYALYPHMTAYQNISFGLTLQHVKEPVYEDRREVKEALLAIAAAEKEIAALSKGNAAREKQLDALDEKNVLYANTLQKLSEKISRLKNKGMYNASVRNTVLKLEARASALREAITANEARMTKLTAAISADREIISQKRAEIAAKRQSIACYQIKRIDAKKAAQLTKSLAYYEKLKESDDVIRRRDEEELKRLSGELAALPKNGTEEQKLRAEGIADTMRRYRDELDILAQRKQSIEQNIARDREAAELYQKEPQPLFRDRRYTKAEIDERVMRAAEILDIKKLLKRKPREMSGGQRQRIALGRAIVREPKVFLLDEPLSNLDAKLRTSMRSEIVKLHRQLNTTFIYVTHDQIEAMTMGTRIVVMKDGEVQQIDTPVNLFDRPVNTFVAGFIGTPQMNMFRVGLRAAGEDIGFTFSDGSRMAFPKASVRPVEERYLDGEEHPVILGVRCEDLLLTEEGKGFCCTVLGVELLGSETNIYTSLEGVDVTLKLNYRPNVCVGDRIFVGMNERKLYLFDANTSTTILK